MTLLHGTKHPYQPGDAIVAGGIVSPCLLSINQEPPPGCSCGCDGRWMVFATTCESDARRAALTRACMCGTGPGHRPRVFEVIIGSPEPDPTGWGTTSVMGTTGRIIRQLWESQIG